MSFSITPQFRLEGTRSLSIGNVTRSANEKSNGDSIIPSVDNAKLIKDWMKRTFIPSWYSNGGVSKSGEVIWPDADRPTVLGFRSLTGGSVNLEDGRVLITEERSDGNLVIYSPYTRSFSVLPSPSTIYSELSLASAFKGAIRLSDGRVLLVPLESPSIGIFDPNAETVELDTVADTVISASGSSYSQGCLMPDGRVFLNPFDSTSIGIYTPGSSSSFTAVDILEVIPEVTAGGYFATSTVTQDGKVVMAPFRSQYIGIFDPITNTLKRGPEVTRANSGEENAYQGSVLAPNGNVIFSPRGKRSIGVYTPPATGTTGIGTFKEVDISGQIPSITSGNTLFDGCILLPTGKILFCSAVSEINRFGLFDPDTEEFQLVGPQSSTFLDRTGNPVPGFSTMCLCQDGTIMCTSRQDASPILLQSTTLPHDAAVPLLESSHSS